MADTLSAVSDAMRTKLEGPVLWNNSSRAHTGQRATEPSAMCEHACMRVRVCMCIHVNVSCNLCVYEHLWLQVDLNTNAFITD